MLFSREKMPYPKLNKVDFKEHCRKRIGTFNYYVCTFHQNANVCKPRGGGHMLVQMFAYKFSKGLSRPSKRKRNIEMGRNCG